MIKPLTIPAGETIKVDVQGRFFRCREASSAFKLKVKGPSLNDEYTLEGGDEFSVREEDQDFRQLTFINEGTADLLVDFFAGRNVIRSAYVKLPRTRMVGRDVSIATNATQEFAGLDEYGKRRKQFTITIRGGIGGYVHVIDKDTDQLLVILDSSSTSGLGFALETDATLLVKNVSSTNPISSTAGTPDISVAETFYR